MNEFSALFSNISTKRDVQSLMSSLENASRKAFSTSGDVDTFLSEQFSSDFVTALKETAASQRVDLGDPSAATAYFQKIRKVLSEVQVVRLRVAFEPTQAQLSQIVSWIRSNGGEQAVLELVYVPGVLGGAVIEYKGRIGNYSLSKRLEGFFKLNVNDVPGVKV